MLRQRPFLVTSAQNRLIFHRIIINNKFMKYRDLEKQIQSPVFSRQELLLHGLTVYDYQLSLWVKKGHLLRLKKGLYVFAREPGRRGRPSVKHGSDEAAPG